jgi:glucosyl-3-phosphoglycerate synthase
MSDFFQTGAIATLHRLGRPNAERLERELETFAKETPIALLLPCHVRDLASPALRGILGELGSVRYLRQIVVGIDGAETARQWKKAREIFARLPQRPVLIWNDGRRISRLLRALEKSGLGAGQRGKGRNVWLGFGYVIASEQARIVAMHDCDIISYSRELLARLCYPLAHPNLGFDFCKGYYARVSDRLHGRVMRLLFTPLVRALRRIIGPHPFLIHLETFRYPLAGEVALHVDQVRRLSIPTDWALEIGILAEAYRNCAPQAMCQAELCDNYDHKHQELSPRDPSRGLHRMVRDVAFAFFRRMGAEGVKIDAGLLDTLLVAYKLQAEESLRFYAADALINSLEYPRHEEELAVRTFVRAIQEAGCSYLDDPLQSRLSPSWNRVESAMPGFFADFLDAVAADNR